MGAELDNVEEDAMNQPSLRDRKLISNPGRLSSHDIGISLGEGNSHLNSDGLGLGGGGTSSTRLLRPINKLKRAVLGLP